MGLLRHERRWKVEMQDVSGALRSQQQDLWVGEGKEMHQRSVTVGFWHLAPYTKLLLAQSSSMNPTLSQKSLWQAGSWRKQRPDNTCICINIIESDLCHLIFTVGCAQTISKNDFECISFWWEWLSSWQLLQAESSEQRLCTDMEHRHPLQCCWFQCGLERCLHSRPSLAYRIPCI